MDGTGMDARAAAWLDAHRGGDRQRFRLREFLGADAADMRAVTAAAAAFRALGCEWWQKVIDGETVRVWYFPWTKDLASESAVPVADPAAIRAWIDEKRPGGAAPLAREWFRFRELAAGVGLPGREKSLGTVFAVAVAALGCRPKRRWVDGEYARVWMFPPSVDDATAR